MVDVARARVELIALGAAEWRDRESDVRAQARKALVESEWSPEVVEFALDNVLVDLDAARASAVTMLRPPEDDRPVLVMLPGNVIGPAIACSYCAAAAGARAILKSPGAERALAPIVERQFERLGAPLAGTVNARYWKGGDSPLETEILAEVRRVIVFGDDETVEAVRRKAGTAGVVGYGDAFSIGFVPHGVPLGEAGRSAALDVAMFDQRGCMSPQTVYVEGDEARALQFARLLAGVLERVSEELPRAAPEPNETAVAADVVRRLFVTALAPKTHGLDTVMVGARRSKPDAGPPDYVVGVMPYAAPFRAGFGRVVAVMPSSGAQAVSEAIAVFGERIDTIGIATSSGDELRVPDALLRTRARRICCLGDMQRPPFGYRPSIADFA